MITVKEAIKIFEKNFPNKKITAINEWNNMYVFGYEDRSLNNEHNWDSRLYAVDKNNGKISIVDAFNMDFIENSKEINME